MSRIPRRTFMKRSGLLLGAAVTSPFQMVGPAAGQGADDPLSRCRVIPLPHDRVSFRIGGQERLKWHFGSDAPRPFFYPFKGPSGQSLTRMGHPGAPNHDHHRSVWFAHHDVEGIDFWSDQGEGRIRQKRWLAYHDGEEQAIMASLLGWADGSGRELMEQELVAEVRPGPEGETFLELQATFRPKQASVTLGETNFGFLAVRVARSISEHFGGGVLTDSEGRNTESKIFGKRAAWMDYSGPVAPGQTAGITYFDHPDNPNHPTHWHVREDGWMGASLCMEQSRTIDKARPLVLRYLLHAHRGGHDPGRADRIAQAFADRPAFIVEETEAPHEQYRVRRVLGRDSA